MAIYVNGKLVAGGGGTSGGGNTGGSPSEGDMKSSVYDPTGKKQDIFAYVDEKTENISAPGDIITLEGGGIARLNGENFGETPFVIEFSEEEETNNGNGGGSNSANDITYNNQTSGATSTNVQGAIDELFTSVSEGKSLIASAITDKGVNTSADASFQVLKDNILKIEQNNGYYFDLTFLYDSTTHIIELQVELENPTVFIEYYDGLNNIFGFGYNKITKGNTTEDFGMLIRSRDGESDDTYKISKIDFTNNSLKLQIEPFIGSNDIPDLRNSLIWVFENPLFKG